MEGFVKLTDVCDFQGGTQPPKSVWKKDLEDGYIRMLQIRDFTQREKDNVEYIPYKKTLKTCEEHDILIGRYGASVGKICTGLSGAYNVALVKTKPNLDKIRRDFLLHLLRGTIFQNFILNVGDRAAQAGFNKGDLEGFEFSLPPLDKQKKIAAILDAADAYRQKTKALIKKYDELTQSLFLDMFGDTYKNSNKFEEVKLSDLIDRERDISYGVVQRGDHDDNGVPLIRIRDIIANTFLEKDLVKTDKANSDKYKRTILKGGEFLISIRGTVGKITIAPNHSKGWNITREVAIIPVIEGVNKTYLLHFLTSRGTRTKILGDVKGVAQSGINLKDLRDLLIYIPPKMLQNQFAERVQAIEAQKAQAQASLAQAEDLFNSLLQRAFKGELV
jgi:type I restriction enzyme S subunit